MNIHASEAKMTTPNVPLSFDAAYTLRPPRMRDDEKPLEIPLQLSLSSDSSANIFLPPGLSLAPDGSFRWGTDVFPLLSGDSQAPPGNRWWSSFSDAGMTAQIASLSPHLNNVLDLRSDPLITEALAEIDGVEGSQAESAAGAVQRDKRAKRRKQEARLTHAADVDGSDVDMTAIGNTLPVMQELAVSLAVNNPLQAYFIPADGVPIPVGGRKQPPVTYFSKVCRLQQQQAPFVVRDQTDLPPRLCSGHASGVRATQDIFHRSCPPENLVCTPLGASSSFCHRSAGVQFFCVLVGFATTYIITSQRCLLERASALCLRLTECAPLP
jgi:hypothetical protein